MITEQTKTLRQIVEDAVFSALERHNWNKQSAADELGVSLKTIYNHIHKMDARLSNEQLSEART